MCGLRICHHKITVCLLQGFPQAGTTFAFCEYSRFHHNSSTMQNSAQKKEEHQAINFISFYIDKAY